MIEGDPIAAVWHALRRDAASTGCALRFLADAARPWWSATFSGHRVKLTLVAAPGPALDAWLATLPEADLPVPDCLVADCAVDRVETIAGRTRVSLSLLILDDL